jgi:hypothetical protein
MGGTVKNLSQDEIAMKVFYESCGISPAITEAAIQMRRDHPVELEKETYRMKFPAKPKALKTKR